MVAKLTDKQEKFVEAYCGPAMGNAKKAYLMAGYGSVKKAGEKAWELMQNPKILGAIEKHKDKRRRSFFLEECDILEGIYKEATNYEEGTQQGRIQAWVWLGKQIGMFQEKKTEDTKQAVTYNIINYSNDNSQDPGGLKEKIEVGVGAHKEQISKFPIKLTNYSEEQDNGSIE